MIDRLNQILQGLESEGPLQADSKVMIIDGTNFYIRCFSASPVRNENGAHLGGSIGFLRSLAKYVREHSPTRVIIFFDGKNGSKKRKQIYSEYKANRLVTKAFNRADMFESLEHERESMIHQFERLIQYLRCLPVQVLSLDNIEADDAIAYCVNEVFTTCKNILLISDDKDYLQFVNERVQVYRPVQKMLYSIESFQKIFVIPPHNFHIYKCFIGDDSDNIPGVPGIGPKTLQKIPELYLDRVLTIYEFLTLCENQKGNKLYDKILQHKDILIRNYELIQLHDVSKILSLNQKLLISDKLKTEAISKTNLFEIMLLIADDGASDYIKDPKHFVDIFKQLDRFANIHNSELG